MAHAHQGMHNRFDLYELAVQSPVMQARFLRALHRNHPLVLREDFCGPASIARAWVSEEGASDRRAIGVDRDPEPIEHARVRMLESAPRRADHLTLEVCDVQDCTLPADIIAAFNFAICELPERAMLLAYLRGARALLNSDGFLACDLYGGRDAFSVGRSAMTIQTPAGPVRYLWEQRSADPLTARVVNAMHFRLPSGEKVRNAFVYHWRLWSVPELRDAMLEAGFASSEVHLSYGDAVDEDGAIITRPHEAGSAFDENYVAYVIGRIG